MELDKTIKKATKITNPMSVTVGHQPLERETNTEQTDDRVITSISKISNLVATFEMLIIRILFTQK
jgi:hypothetical protein